MNNFRFWLISVLAIIMLTGSKAAAREGQGIPLDLADAIHTAMRLRPELHLEKKKEYIAKSKVKEAKGNFFPTLDLTGSSSYIKNYDTFTGINVSARIADQNVSVDVQKEVPPYELNSQLDFAYNLYDGGKDSALLGEALSKLDSEKYNISIITKKLKLDVVRAYWGLKKAKIRYLIAKRDLAVAQLAIKVARAKYHIDRLSDVDFAAAQLDDLEKEVALKTADRACLQAFYDYLHVLGLSEAHTIMSSAQIPALTDIPDIDDNAENRTTYYPELQKIRSDIRAGKEEKKAAQANNYPTMDFFANYALIGRDSNSYFDSWSDLRSEQYVVGIKFSFNLFNGMRTEERISQAETEVQVRQLQLKVKKRQLQTAVAAKKVELAKAKDQLQLATARERLKEALFKVAKVKFQNGKISALTYRQNASELKNAVDGVTLAKINVVLARNAFELMVLE